MEETELGRPARHARRARHRHAPASMEELLRKGEGKTVRVRGKRRCECGAEIKVDFSGPDDSLGARLARGQLAGGRCATCVSTDETAELAAERLEAQTKRIRDRVVKSGVPKVWSALSLDELREHPQAHIYQQEAIDRAAEWAAARDAGGLLLHGGPGRGKTLIAAAAAVQRCAHGHVRWLPVADLLMDLRMPFEAPEYARAQRKLDPMPNVGLILDDLDKLKPTEHALQPLYVAINGWYEQRQPLIVTCNRNLDELAMWMGETFGEALASRLAGYCEVVEIKGEDWRLS